MSIFPINPNAHKRDRFSLSLRTASITRRPSNVATRIIASATNRETEQPEAVFLCKTIAPDIYERHLRESFITVCSVEDYGWYPIAVSTISEASPEGRSPGDLVYAVQENKMYELAIDGTWRDWIPGPSQLQPDLDRKSLPFFRKHTIDIIVPHVSYVDRVTRDLERALGDLSQDLWDVENLLTE